MAHREDWDGLRKGSDIDDNAWDDAIDDLDRDFEHRQYYVAQAEAHDRFQEYRDEPNDDDLDGQHHNVELREEARAEACGVAEQRYLWHGRWDKAGYADDDDDNDDGGDGHENQADGWANRAQGLLRQRNDRNVEQDHDYVDRRDAWGVAMLAGFGGDNDLPPEDENEPDVDYQNMFDEDDQAGGGNNDSD